LIVEGFFEPVLQRISVPALRVQVAAMVAQRIEGISAR
jgi:hypothetical protein